MLIAWFVYSQGSEDQMLYRSQLAVAVVLGTIASTCNVARADGFIQFSFAEAEASTAGGWELHEDESGPGPNTLYANAGAPGLATQVTSYGPGSNAGSYITTGRSWAESDPAVTTAQARGHVTLFVNGTKAYVLVGSYVGRAAVGGHTGGSVDSDFGTVTERGFISGPSGDGSIAESGDHPNSTRSSAHWILSIYEPVSSFVFGDVSKDGDLDELDIMLTQGHIGTSEPDFDLNNDSQVTQADADVILGALGTVRGDTDLDGDVDLDDFNAVSTFMSKAGLWESGDFDRSGVVDLDDFNVLAANYGYPFEGSIASPSPEDWASLAAAAVPEPSGITLPVALAALIAQRRRR